MENIFDRLQFVRGLNPLREDGIFNSREDAVNYVIEKQVVDRPTVVGEPMVLRYDSGSATKGPHVILAIGSLGVGTPTPANRTFFIDIQKTEEEIAELDEKLEAAIKSLTLIPLESETLKLQSEKTDDGTILSGDVKIADYRIVSGRVNENIIQTEGDKGLYAFVDMDYDPETFVITFNVNGVTKEFQLPVDQHVVKGWYDPREESIFLKLADDSQVKVLVTKLIEEWTVLPDGQTINDYDVSGTTVNFTPIVFAKTHVGSKATEHEGIYEWQDVLEADIRVADHITDNILHKDRTGRYLYVKGTADNILYKDGQTVKDALDNVDCKVSTSTGNLIYKRPDGIFAAAMLDYDAATNKIKYKYSDGNAGEIKEVEFQLNSVKVLEDITYDPINETIVIRYIDAQGEYQKVVIPVKDIIEEWDVNNEAHNIFLNKYRSEGQGKDILTADVKIHEGDNNILEDKNHELYVNGVSKNIKYDVTGDTTVKNVLDNLSAKTEVLDVKIDQEIADRIADVDRIDTTIGSGFSTDAHETVTYKFEQLTDKVNEEAEKLQAEIDRSTAKDTEHDGRLDAIDAEIGDGFGPRNTVRDEIDNLQNEIDELSGETLSRLTDVINEDHSINIETRNDGNGKPTVKVIDVNLSEEVEDNKPNIIKLNTDGLYAGVDLIYEFNEEVGTNQLIFKTTNGTKVYDLKTNSVVDKIYYDANREAIIIEYTVNGHRMPDVVIPVGDLINEWRVWDGHEGAVQLEKIRIASGATDKDVLKAEVVITSAHTDNILVNDDGALYVSRGPITDLESRMDSAEERLDQAESDIDALENGLSEEIRRATYAEEALDRKIDAETERAIAREDYIIEELNREISRSTAKDTELSNLLNEEIDRSTTKDRELTDTLNNEIVRATSAETALGTKIDVEAARAQGEEQRIETKLDNEISRSVTRDEQLSLSAHTISNNLSDEIARAIDAENQLSNSLTAEVTRAEAAETALDTKIDNETTRAQGEEQRIETKLDNEISRSTAKDSELQSQINNVESNLSNEIDRAKNAESALTTNLLSEIERAKLAEKELGNALSGETIRATSQETYLLHLIEDEAEKRISGDSINSAAINTEETRARESEARLDTAIASEVTRAQAAESEIRDAITAETLRAQNADNELYQRISDEIVARANGHTTLSAAISTEISRATVAEGVMAQNLADEITRSTTEDERLANLISTETATRQAADDELEEAIRKATLTFDDTTSIDFNIPSQENNIVKANVKLQEGDNIIKVGEGLYATVNLSYDAARNTIKLVTSNGEQEAIQLNTVGSLIDGMEYDATNRALVIKYHDAAGNPLQTSFPVNQLFNDWVVDNPSEKSAVKLVKTTPAEPDDADTLSGFVLITDDRDGDGKPDEGSDNLIEIRNNGLYVCGSAMTDAHAIAECVKNEIKVLEKAVIGHAISEECGSGFTYEPNIMATYINSATSFNSADNILDNSIKNLSSYTENVEDKVDIVSASTECAKKELKTVEDNILGMPLTHECGEGDSYRANEGTNYISAGTSFNSTDIILDREIKKTNDNIDIVNQRIDIVSGDVTCVSGSTNALYKLLYGANTSLPECGEGAEYMPYQGCVISSARSFMEADEMLNDQLCQILTMWASGETPTTKSDWVEDGLNRKLQVDAKLSHGSHNGMTDDELTIYDNEGSYIDPTGTEFTDTNALRIVHVLESPDGFPLPVSAPYNGIYLSNVWDCGLYYSETVDAAAIAAAEAAGYITTNYRTDENSSASNYNYMNNVRQSDV